MNTLKKWFANKWFRRAAFVLAGALVGFAYYYFIGCASGRCPLTSNPYISIGYGSLFGLVLSGGGQQPRETANNVNNEGVES